MAVKGKVSRALDLRRSLSDGLEGFDGLDVCRLALFDGFLKNHILELYGATLLGSANISHLVPSVNAFPPLVSQFSSFPIL